MTHEQAQAIVGQTVTLRRFGQPQWRRTVTVTGIGRIGTSQLMLIVDDGSGHPHGFDVDRHEVADWVIG